MGSGMFDGMGTSFVILASILGMTLLLLGFLLGFLMAELF